MPAASDKIQTVARTYDSERRNGRNMTLAARKIKYPYIVSRSGIAGGRPVIAGTRITVNCIAGYHQLGMNTDDILDSLRHLTPARSIQPWPVFF